MEAAWGQLRVRRQLAHKQGRYEYKYYTYPLIDASFVRCSFECPLQRSFDERTSVVLVIISALYSVGDWYIFS